ncbi:hypothetical protein RB595_004035 [Gaeumannomyces hyphopodioides]
MVACSRSRRNTSSSFRSHSTAFIEYTESLVSLLPHLTTTSRTQKPASNPNMPPRRKRLFKTTGRNSSEHDDSDPRPTKRITRQVQARARSGQDSAEDSEAAASQDSARNTGPDDDQLAASTVARQIMDTQRTILQELEEAQTEEEEQRDTSAESEDGLAGDAPDVYSCVMASSGGSKEEQKLFKATESLFHNCKSTLANYRSVKRDVNQEKLDGNEQPPTDGSGLLDSSEAKWLEDTQSLDQIVDFAHIWAKHIAVCMITGERPRDPSTEDLDEKGEMAIDSFQKSGDMASGTGSWGKARRVQVKALRMLATGSDAQDGRQVDNAT